MSTCKLVGLGNTGISIDSQRHASENDGQARIVERCTTKGGGSDATHWAVSVQQNQIVREREREASLDCMGITCRYIRPID